jgi:cell division topological specificity factor
MAFFDIFKKKTVSSSNIAKGRLQLALASDRAGCSPEIMEKIKNDIINVISKYIEIDVAGLDIKIQQTEGENGEGLVPVLFANIPVKEIRRG